MDESVNGLAGAGEGCDPTMVSVVWYKGRPGKSKFDALAPLFGRQKWSQRLEASAQLAAEGDVLTGVSRVVNISVVPLCFTCHFPNTVGRRRASLLLVGFAGETCLWL